MKVNITGRGIIPGLNVIGPVYGKDLSEREILRFLNFSHIRVYDAKSGVLIGHSNVEAIFEANHAAVEVPVTTSSKPIVVEEAKEVVVTAPVVEEVTTTETTETVDEEEEVTEEETVVEDIVEDTTETVETITEETETTEEVEKEETVAEPVKPQQRNHNYNKNHKNKKH